MKIFTLLKLITLKCFLVGFLLFVSGYSLKAQTGIEPIQVGGVYQVATLENLTWIAEQVNNGTDFSGINFKQTANINASATTGWNSGKGWTAIGGTDAYYVFSGTYDGQGYTISNLYINNPSANYYGFFGFCANATLKNIGLTNVSINSGDYVGGLVGYIQPGMISNCYVTGSVTSQNDVGGLIGEADNTTIDNCYAECTVTCTGVGYLMGAGGGLMSLSIGCNISNSYASGSVTVSNSASAGGFSGGAYDTNISSCYSSCVVSTNGVGYDGYSVYSSNIGAFLGTSKNGTILNCYANGSISANGVTNVSQIGGFAGLNGTSISYCYTTSSISITGTSDPAKVGGFVGVNDYPDSTPIYGVVNANCYWNSTIFSGNGCGTNPGGATFSATGKTSAQMQTATPFISSSDWSTKWIFASGSYPQLNWSTTFTGSGNWSTSGNWSNGVPGLNNDVTINGSCTVDESTCAKNLTVNLGSSISISALQSLGVKDNLTLKSDATNTASLINSGNLSVTGTTYAERYLTGNAWHVVSPIAVGQNVADFLTANTSVATSGTNRGLMDYKTSTNTWNTYYQTTGATGTMDAGKGYSTRITANGTVTYTGTLTSGNTTVSLSNVGQGWNCVGNPYPSAINMNNAASAANNFLKTNALDAVNIDPSYCVYVWNDGSKTYQVLNNVPGNPRDPGINVFSPGQGFFVKANGAGTIQFTTAMQVHNTSAVLKSTDIPWTSVALKATSTSTSSTAQVYFHEGMTKGLDPTYDAGLLRGSNGLSVYTKLVDDNGVDFAIQCLPENGMENFVIPVGLDAKAGGEVKFNATCTGLPMGSSVILEDRTAKVYTDLSKGGEYVVTLSANSSGTGRFYIHTSNLTTGTSDLLPDGSFRLKAYLADGVIWIDGHVSNKAVARLYDARGSQIGRYNLEEGNRNSIPASGLTSGVYILKVIDGNNTFATKLVLVSNL